MLVPHIAGGSPVICAIIAHSRRASSRRCPSGTPARKSSTDAPVRRVAGPLLAAMPSCSHDRPASARKNRRAAACVFRSPWAVSADTIALPSGTRHFAFSSVTALRRHDRVRFSGDTRHARSPAPGLPPHRGAEDGHHVPAARHLGQSGPACQAGDPAARLHPPRPLPGQPRPARRPADARRPGRPLGRRMGRPGPPGPQVSRRRDHLRRTARQLQPGTGRPRRPLARSRGAARRPHRPRLRQPAPGRMAGGGQVPPHGPLGGMARRRQPPRQHRGPARQLRLLGRPRHAGHAQPLVTAPAAGPDPRHHDAAGRLARRSVAPVRRGRRHRLREDRPLPGARQHLPRPRRDRVPAPDERDAQRRDAGLVLHPATSSRSSRTTC